jgi:Rrf2 family nitric oxide-sensitive transcriptional repressor
MRLSKTTNYAIRILIDCAQAKGTLVKVAEIAARRGISQQNTFKIVHLLSRAGFVVAVRGRHGGVRLARPASEIHIGNVVRAMETMRFEIEGGASAMKGKTRHRFSDLNQIFDTALEAFIGVLDGHSLEELAKTARADHVSERQGSKRPAKTKPATKSAGPARRQQSDL